VTPTITRGALDIGERLKLGEQSHFERSLGHLVRELQALRGDEDSPLIPAAATHQGLKPAALVALLLLQGFFNPLDVFGGNWFFI
jgi:hypothetical protein